MTYCLLLWAAAAKTVRAFLEWVTFWNGWWFASWPDTKYIIHWHDIRDSKPHFESKLGGVNAAKLAKKLVWKMLNEFSTRSNKNNKLISCPIIDQTVFCQNYIWNSQLNSALRITRPKKLGPVGRALCRIKLLPVTHVLVDTWMFTVKPVYKLLNVSDDLTWTTNTHVTPFSLTFKA